MDPAGSGGTEQFAVPPPGFQRVAVQWEREPDEWLWPVVHALQESALVCRPPHPEKGLVAQTILRVSVTHIGQADSATISVRTPQFVRATTSIPSNSTDQYLYLVAEEAALRFSSRPLLSTRLGRALQHVGCLSRSCALLLMICAGLILNPFSSYSVIIPAARRVVDGCLQETAKVSVELRYIWNSLLVLLLQWVFFVLTFQRFNRAMFFRTVRSFECFWLVSNLLLLEAPHLLEVFLVAAPAGNLSRIELAAQLVYAVTTPLWGVWIATIDAWMISRRTKAIIMTVAVVSMAWVLYGYAYLRLWSSMTFCSWTYCTTAKNIAVSAAGNLFVFCAKLWLAYVVRRPFAILRAPYRLPRNSPLDQSAASLPGYLLPDCCFFLSCCTRNNSAAQHSVAQAGPETLARVFGHAGVQTTPSLRSGPPQEVENSHLREPVSPSPTISFVRL